MNSLALVPAVASNNSNRYEYTDYEEITEQPVTDSFVSFLDANTNRITMDELKTQCVVPTWANQELTISHQDFIESVHDAAKTFYQGETVTAPSIRVSHIVRGRTPNALGKRASELLECEKTQFYQRLAFAFVIPTIYETIEGQRLELCIGGVRNYNDLNLYRASKGVEKFSVFVGWRVHICSNQILTGQGVKLSMEVMELRQLYQQVMELFNQFNPAKDLHLMQQLSNSYLTETQFAQIVGRMRLYQAIPQGLSRRIPRLLITDSQINNVCRGYYQNEDFGGQGGAISMWNFHNLLTESNKSSYIDTYLSRAVNLYMQKEQLTLLDGEGKPTMFAPIMIATLSTCAQLERESIKFRLNSGRKLYIERGGKLGRKVGSVKTTEQKREEHKDIISYLKRGYSVRNVAKLTSKGISTVQRIKTEFEI